jgi:hypothetical protein
VPARLGDRQTAIPRGKARRVDHRVVTTHSITMKGEAMLRGQGAPPVTSKFDVVGGVDHDVQPGGQMGLSQRRSDPIGGEAGLETARDTGPDDRGLDGIHRQDGTAANPPDASAIVLLPEPARPDMTINMGSVCSILKGPETWP